MQLFKIFCQSVVFLQLFKRSLHSFTAVIVALRFQQDLTPGLTRLHARRTKEHGSGDGTDFDDCLASYSGGIRLHFMLVLLCHMTLLDRPALSLLSLASILRKKT